MKINIGTLIKHAEESGYDSEYVLRVFTIAYILQPEVLIHWDVMTLQSKAKMVKQAAEAIVNILMDLPKEEVLQREMTPLGLMVKPNKLGDLAIRIHKWFWQNVNLTDDWHTFVGHVITTVQKRA